MAADWITITAGQLATERSGSVDPSKFPDELFDLYSIPSYDTGEPEVLAGREIGSSKKIVSPGEILISKIVPHIRRVWIVGPDRGRRQIASSEWISFRGDQVHPEYLRFFLLSDSFHSKFMGTVTGVGGSLLRARPSEVYKIQIPLPPLATQRHITQVLEQADCLRRQAQQMEAELDRLAQALFLEMFGNLFANPKQWPVAELGSLIEQGPKNGLYKHSDDYGSGTPIVRIDNFYAGELTDPASFKRVSLSEAEQENYRLADHSILINRVNSPEYLGKAALVESLTELTVFESNMMNFSVDQSRIAPVFLVTQLGSQYVREQIRKASKDAANQSSINQGDVRAFSVVVPPMAEQNRFAHLLASIRHVRSMAIERSGMFEQAFQSLMQRAFKGELIPKLA